MNKKELILANPESFANGKTRFLCGSTEHMKYPCLKFKADQGDNCTYSKYPAYKHRSEECWEDPKNTRKRCPGQVSRIKKADAEAQGGLLKIFR